MATHEQLHAAECEDRADTVEADRAHRELDARLNREDRVAAAHQQLGPVDRAPAAVVETVDRCYRLIDRFGNRGWDTFSEGRFAGYCQTLALLLGIETREVERLLRERAL